MKFLKIWSFMAKEALEIWPLKILAYLGSAVIFELEAIFKSL